MDDSRTKLVGPAIAVGAVSLGLIVIGACGVGQQDVYVPPPPLRANLAAAPSPVADDTTSTTTRIPIPPSPTWRIAPYMSPRKPFSLSSTETTPSGAPSETEEAPESRAEDSTTEPPAPEPTTTTPEPEPEPEPEPTFEPTTETETPTTTRPYRTTTPPLTELPTRTVSPPPWMQSPVDEEPLDEEENSAFPTRANDHTAPSRTPTPAPAQISPTITSTPAHPHLIR
ncbi:hypothetical protein [Nocardia rhizosphaerae]|uniref:Uncharacterized protein n=1 Tax=Nocardia rhizosphaerae TaxID=1691571 RepID=A0ABV8L447_9NOCA